VYATWASWAVAEFGVEDRAEEAVVVVVEHHSNHQEVVAVAVELELRAVGEPLRSSRP